jgi:hypothetical protein
MNRTQALAELTRELRSLLNTVDLLLPDSDSDAATTTAILDALSLLRRGSMNTLLRMEAIDAVTPG